MVKKVYTVQSFSKLTRSSCYFSCLSCPLGLFLSLGLGWPAADAAWRGRKSSYNLAGLIWPAAGVLEGVSAEVQWVGFGPMLVQQVKVLSALFTHTGKTEYQKLLNKYSQKWNYAASVPAHTFMFLWEMYIFPWSVCLFYCRKIGGPFVGAYNRSQKHECGNWGWCREISFLGEQNSDFFAGQLAINSQKELKRHKGILLQPII